MEKVFKIFESEPYLTYSFAYLKQYHRQRVTIVKIQNMSYRFLEIRFIIEVMTSLERLLTFSIYISYSSFFLCVNSNCLRPIAKKAQLSPIL